MKKIIALLTCVSAVASASMLVSAAPVTLVDQNATPETRITTTYDASTQEFVTTVDTSITGSQATLLAFNGVTLDTETPGTNIQAIDQNGVATFRYKMKVDPVVNSGDKFTIKVGGSNLSTPLTSVVIPEAKSTVSDFTIKGTISNVAAPLDYSEMWDIDDPEAFAIDADVIWKTKVTLIPYNTLNLLAKNYMDSSYLVEPYVEQVVAEDYASATDGKFTLTLPSTTANGKYALVVRRPGYMAYFKEVNFAGANVTLDSSIVLLPGDVLGDENLDIGGIDLRKILDNLHYYGDGDAYIHELDLDANASVDGIDLRVVLDNQSAMYTDYPDGFLDDLLYE